MSLKWSVVTGVGWLCASLLLSACSQDLAVQTEPPPSQPPSPTADQLGTLIAMQQKATEVPTATPLPTSTRTPTPTLTPTSTLTPTLAPTQTAAPSTTPAPTETPPMVFPTNTPRSTPAGARTSTTAEPTAVIEPTAELVVVADQTYAETGERRDHYWLARPFPRDSTNAIRDYASRSYSYGTMGDGGFQTHHGVDIENLLGTGILAAGSGWVFYAGDDSEVQFGPQTNFYGNLVVIEHDRLAPNGQPLYTLYGHMFRVDVGTGQRVEQGEKIGQVGATGVALGSHLHLEVRIGDPYAYGSTYNPDLWVMPWPGGYGTLAGRVTDSDGNRLYNVPIVIQSEGGASRQTYSYADDGVNPDPYYREHYTYGDLPAGEYRGDRADSRGAALQG